MPKYKVNGEVYNIPDDAVAGFEKKYPDATVAYYDGGDKYNIPISMRGDFEKKYPNATTSAPTIKEQKPAVEQPTAVAKPMKSDTIQPVQPIAQPTIVAQNESQTNGDYAIGFKQGLEQGWKGLKEGTRYFAGETANVFTGSSEDEQRAIEAISRLEEEGVNIADYAQPLSKSLEKVYKRGIASSGDNISTLTETEQEQVRAILEENEIKKTIADAIKEAGGDLDKAKQLLSRAATPTWGDRIKADAADEMSKMKPTKGFGAWVGNLIPQMIPSAAAMALSAVTKNPKYAKLIGHLGMGTMTASTAGQSMKEARDAGASGSEVWAVGIADGIIEYATEKIPFDRYTTRLFNGTKRKVGQELANAVVDNNSPARNELEKLLTEANKKLGGKLLNGKTVKDYATDVLAEGASEFTAEALQTITPMIYENPDDYPTITEILQNGWEGAKAGLFMGSVLGGASKIAEHRQQRSRRQQQGFVDVAQVQVKDDGTAEVGEVIGVNNENGNLSLLIDGKVQEFTPESVKGRHRFTFEEFDKGVVQMEQDESFDNGAALETPQEKNDAQNMFEYQQQQMRQYFGLGEDGDVDAFLGDDPIAGLQRVAANDQEAGQVVLDYLNAKATVDGVFQRMSDDAEAKIAEADAIIASRTNRNNGLIQRVRLKNDKQAYVLSGDIVMTDDGDMVNVSKSSESLVVIDAITGKKEYTYPSNIAEVYQSVDAEAERQTLRNQVIDEYSQKLADDMNGTLAFAPGDNYTLVDDQGTQHNVQIVADNGDGTVAIIYDNEQEPTIATKTMVQEMSDTYNQLRLGKYLQEKKAQEIAIAEQEAQAEQPEVVAEEQQQQPVSALSQVPTNKNGKHDFNQVSPDVAWSAIVEMTGGAVDDALDTAKQMQKQSNDALKAAQKEKPKVGTDVESIIANKNAHKEKINGLQAIADHWANIVALGEQSAQQNEQTEEVVAENVVAEETAPVAEQTEVAPEVAPVAEEVVEPTTEEQAVEQSEISNEPTENNADFIGRSLTSDEAKTVILAMQQNAEQVELMELTPENWIAQFGEDGILATPIGDVKMGENQYFKLAKKGRDGKLGMIKPTLLTPDVIIEEKSTAKDGQVTERDSSYVFVKAFTNDDGSRNYLFTSVTIRKEGKEVVISNQEKETPRIERLLKEGKLAYISKATLPSEPTNSTQGNQSTILGGAILSESKDTTTEPITQEVEQENLQPTPENVAEEQMEVATEQPKSETVEPTSRGAVDMDTLQLTMSDEEFNSLLESGDVERMNGYLKELDDTLVINDQSPFKGQQELREEFKRLKDQYGGEDNIPTDVMEDINARYKPYAELSQKVYDRKYTLEDRLRSAEVQATQTAKKEENEVKETHQVTAFNGFLADKTKLGASNAEKALSKKVKIEDKNYTIAEYVEQAVQSGTIELRTSEVPKYKGVSRRKWNQMDAAQQQAEQERIKNGGTTTEYYINDYNLGKTAYDYAQYLQAKAEVQKAAEPEWLQKVPTDGRNFMVYTKVAGENNYSATDLKTGQAVGLVYASLVKRDRLQSLVEELPKVLLEGAHFQIRDTNGKIYYSSEPIAPTKGKKKATTKLTTLKTVSGAEVKVPINLYKYVSTDKTKAYTGVYFDPEGFVVATDGHNMIAVKHDVAEADAERFISKAGDVSPMIFNWRIANPKPNTEKPTSVDFVDVEKQIGDKFVVFEIDGQEVGFPPKAIHVLADFQRAFGGQAFVGDMTAGKAIVIRSGDNYAIALQTTKYADLLQAIHIPSGIEQTTEQVEQPATVSEQAQQPTEPTKQESKPKRAADRKIEDYGEKIAGARKDILRNMSKNFDNATIESLVALPFAKAFVKPDLKKLVEAGVLRPDDAKYAEAIMWVYINKNKPKARKTDEWAAKRGRETRITAWAKKTFDGITRLRDFIEADEATRDELIAQYGQLGEQIKAEENAYRNSKVGQFNAAANGYGDLYSPNPIEVIVAALDKLNYQAGDKITFDAPIVKAEYLGRFYNFENQDGEKVYAFSRANSIEEAIDTLVLQAKIRRGDTDIQYPTDMFSITREDPIKEPSGMFTVFHINKRGSLISETVEGREAAEKKVADYQSQGLSADLREEKKVVGYATHRIRFKNRLTDVETIFDEKFGSEGEARQALEERYDEFNDLANDYVASLSKQKREQPVPFEVTSLWNSETKEVKYVVKNTETGDVMSPQLDTRKEAEEYYKNHIEEWKAKWQEMKDARKKFVFFDDNVKPREGKDYRNGRDVTVEDLATTFGFRGIQFGNWTNDADRQAALNQAYDAFMDLADILGVSPKALSLAGELGIAFGARGGGSALAHYEPDEIVINLTKTKGAGSLAHEWWHALDNYFSRQGNIPMGFVTSNPAEAKMREEMRAAWQGVVNAVKGTEYAKRSMAQGDYWGRMLEMTARLFGEWTVYELAKTGRTNHFLSRGITPSRFDMWRRINYAAYKWSLPEDQTPMPFEEFALLPRSLKGMPFPTKEETEQMGEAVRNLFDVVQEKVDEQGNVVLFQRGDFPEMPNTEANRRAYNLVREKLQKIGIKVHEVSEEMADAMASLTGAQFAAKRKSAPETVLPEDESSFKGTAISTADGAKILKNLDNLANKYQELSNRPWTFIGDVANALGISMPNKASKYGIFEAMNGNEITIRLSDHNATVSNLDGVGENNAISIVISRKPNNGITNDGNAHIVEYYYPASKIQKADGKPLVDIITSIKQALYSGEYEDITGLAEREEVNLSNAEYQIVYHGSGAKFDRFDHSFMGTGEGAQAYGYGTYVTQVEGIGKTYAKSVRNSSLSLSYKGVKVDTEGHYNPWRIILDMYNDSRGKLRDMRAKAERYEYMAEEDSPMKPVWREVVRILKDDVRAGDLAVAPTRVLYSVEIPDSNGEFLQWDGEVADDVVDRLRDELTEEYGEDVAFAANLKYGQTGQHLYQKIERALGSGKAASEFLNRNGFVGIEYPAQYRSGGRADNAKNYVIFNESDLKIIDRVELFQDAEGKIYGWAVGGEIYLTPDGLNANTAIHEYSHLWVEAMRKKDSKKWGEIKSQLKATPFWQQVLDDLNYENIRENEEAVASEVLARLSGNKGAERLANEAQRIIDAGNGDLMARVESSALVQHVKRLLRDFYAWVSRNVFGITNEATISRVADMVVDDLLDEVVLDNIEESPYEAMVGNKQEDTDDNKRSRITPAMDKAYMDAVERGDMETAQRMVLEAAKRAGYTIRAFHGTPNKVYNPDWKEAVAEIITILYPSVGQINLDAEYGTEEYKKAWELANEVRYYYRDYKAKLPQTLQKRFERGITKPFTVFDTTKRGSSTGAIDAYNGFFFTPNPLFASSFRATYAKDPLTGVMSKTSTGDGVLYDVVIKPNNILDLRSLPATRSKAKQMGNTDGYDVVINKVKDGRNNNKVEEEIMVKDPSLIKSADPVTYDDNGNVIPLSQRFNNRKNDIRYRSDVDEVFDADFAELESEYQQLDKNDEQAMTEWRAKKKRIVEDYLNYMTDDLALPASVFVYDHNDKGSLDEAVRLIAEVVADKLGENVEELYLPDHKKDLDEFTDAIAAFTEVGRIINGRGMYNVGRAVDNNKPLSWFGAVVHENAHHLLKGKHTEQEFADIWNEAVENEAPIVSKIQEHYAAETNATKGEEVVAFAVGGYAGSKHTHIFASYIKGDGEVSLDDIVKKLNKSLPLRNELVIEVLNDLRNEYQRREAEVNTDRGNQEANREREAARKGQESGERSSRQDSAQIPEQESHRYVGGYNAEGYGQFGYNLNAIATAAEELAGQLHTPIRIIGDVSDINDDDLNTRRRKRSYKGWYDVSTGEVVVVAPNATSVADVQRTVIHEVVAHNGLRELFGADFDTFLDNVYRNVDEPIRRAIANLAARKGWDFRVATEEYLASLAETTNFDEIEKQGWWQKIKDYFMDLLRKVGIKLAKPLTNDELRYILWRSYQMQTSKGAMAVAEDVDMQRKLGVGNFRTQQAAARLAEILNNFTLTERNDSDFAYALMKSIAGQRYSARADYAVLNGVEIRVKEHTPNWDNFLDWETDTAKYAKILNVTVGDYNSLDYYKDKSEYEEFVKEHPETAAVDVFIEDGTTLEDALAQIHSALKDRGIDFEFMPNYDWVDLYSEDENDLSNRLRAREGSGSFAKPNAGVARDIYNEKVRTPKTDTKRWDKEYWSVNTAHRLHEAYVDSMAGLKTLQEAILKETGNEIHSYEDAYKAENRMSSENKAQAEIYMRDFFQPLMDEVGKLSAKGATLDDIKMYLIAKHGLERNVIFSQRAAAERGEAWDGTVEDYSGLTDLTGEDKDFQAAAQHLVQDFEAGYDTKPLWDKINAATKESLRINYESGLMSKETYDKVRTMFAYYVPLRGWDRNVAADEYEYLTSNRPMLSPTLKTAKGRKSLADDPIATIGYMAESAIIQGNRNLMKQKFLNFVLNNPTSLATVSEQWYVRSGDEWVPSTPDIPADATADEVDAIVKAHEQKMEALGDDATKKRDGLKIGLHTTAREGQEHVIRVKRAGKEYCIYINGNPIAAQAINGLTNPNTDQNAFEEVAQGVKNLMARAFTSQNPAFIVTNLSRDVIWAGTAVAVKEDKAYAAQYTKNVTKILATFKLPVLLRKFQNGTLDMNNDIERYFAEFIRNGGETGFTQINTVEDYKRDIERMVKDAKGETSKLRKAWQATWGGIEFLNRSAEDITRFSVYMTSRQMGRDVARSVWDAKEITVNFNKKGRGTFGASMMNFAYIFFNASIQGLANFGRLMYHHPKKMTLALSTFASAGMIAPMFSILLSALLGDDDDNYWDLPEWVRRNNIVLFNPFSERGFFTIPLPHELRPFYGMGELFISVMMGKESVEDALGKAARGFADLLPIDVTGNGGNMAINLAPTVAQPVAQLIANTDYFGVPIYRRNDYNELDPDWTKAYKGTNPFLVESAKWLNEVTGGDNVVKGKADINPAIVEHLFESYLGGMGKTFNKTVTTFSMLFNKDAREWRNVPVLSSFYQVPNDRTSGSQINREYFEARDEAKEIEHQFSGYKKQLRMGAMEYAEKLDELVKSPIFARYQVVNGYNKAITKLNTALKQTTDPTNREEIETTIMELKAKMLAELETLDAQTDEDAGK